ncbi:MAG: hypothetical protein CL963_03570 [Euryarchaeota archaeon]|jgi:trk system potassium uptake protein TrkA|nr:hypothetical protein [Euryarchaeota archaeon]HIK01240.1 NAD-binding protein [Candidatus Undinarchaeales archaeon ERR594346 U_76725]|tara:strand:+ start:8623 stop:9282 length:660 start_codon:yes stop_codon:yes gene_type:complete
MYVIIAGGGNSGEALAKSLVTEKEDVVLIESDKERAERLAEELDALIISGDSTNIDVLKDAGIEKADAVVAMTGDDKTNLMICEIANQAKVKRVLARINEPENEALFIQAGVESAISSTSSIVTDFNNVLRGKGSKTVATLASGAIEVMEIYVGVKSKIVGKNVSEAGIDRNDAKILSIERKGEVIIADDSRTIKKGDILGVIAKSSSAKKVVEHFEKK